MNHRHIALVAFCALLVAGAIAQAQSPSIHIDVAGTAAKVSPTLYGLMTEEINYSYDGGLYGELIRNRVFKGSEYARGGTGTPLAHWSVAQYNGSNGTISIDTAQPVNAALGNSLKLDATSLTGNQSVGIANDGYWGIPLRPNTTYHASFYGRAASGAGPLTVAIESSDGKVVYAQGEVPQLSGDWQQYTVDLKTADVKETADARFVISASYPSTYWFNLVSLFPPTYNNRPNGNRIDIMQKLVDMKPTFLRFPGGNYVEGRGRDDIFDWKKTVGPIAQRPTHLSPWNYRSSDGMGLLEFLEWTEDMHAQPVMAVFAGFALSGSYVATGDALKPFVQDALDEIEYATGDASTKWGAQRIADGRQEPFVVNFVEIGNEDNLGGAAPTYNERFTAFYDAIHAKYPAIKIIATTAVKSRVPYAIDDHHYWNSAAEAQAAAHLYDPTGRLGKRDGPRLFIGEWADRYYTAPAGRGRGGRGARGATGPASGPAALPVAPPVARGPAPVQPPTTNLGCGLADAAFMTGFERNADLIEMSCYAPLFVNVNPGGMQWASDLIGYDALNSFGSPSYYAQKMFSEYLGDVVPPSFMDNVPKNAAGAEQVFYCVTRDSKNGAVDLKVVNVSGSPQSVQIDLHGVASVDSDATSCVLSGSSVNDTNTITDREKVVPVTSKISGVSANFTHEFPAYSVTVLQLQTH